MYLYKLCGMGWVKRLKSQPVSPATVPPVANPTHIPSFSV